MTKKNLEGNNPYFSGLTSNDVFEYYPFVLSLLDIHHFTKISILPTYHIFPIRLHEDRKAYSRWRWKSDKTFIDSLSAIDGRQVIEKYEDRFPSARWHDSENEIRRGRYVRACTYTLSFVDRANPHWIFVRIMQINEPWRDVIKLIAEKYARRLPGTKDTGCSLCGQYIPQLRP